MKRIALALIVFGFAGAIVFYILTIPSQLAPDEIAAAENGDVVRGERVFWAGGCASCHAEKVAQGADRLKLGGGLALATPFGTFHAPNISPDPATGIGAWTVSDFANAMKEGVSPEGDHYYPSFPYTSYTRMTLADIGDLWAYMRTLPAVDRENVPHDLPLPFRLRRGIGLWKLMFLSDAPVVDLRDANEQVRRGQYLVEGPGHCGECHTPRDMIGGLELDRWLAGGPAPEGEGKIPNITPDAGALGSWSESDIVYALETGFMPDFDTFGSSMVDVQENMANLPAIDREAIAAYLKAVPALPSQ